VLASLLCVTEGVTRADDNRTRRFFLGGLCLGAVCGLKLTHLIFALGMSAALVVLWPFFRFRLAALVSFALGGIVGFVSVGGYWATKLWIAFRNPMFPFFNGLFGSPWYESVSFTDVRFLPTSFPHAMVTYPFAWMVGMFPTSELPFREPRFAFVAALLPLAVVVALLRSKRAPADGHEAVTQSQDFWLLVLFFVFSFAIWLKQFGIQRYALPLELLTGLIVFISLERVLGYKREVMAVLGIMAVFAILWTRPPDWERMPYGDKWFGVEPVQSPAPTLYVMMSGRPMAYIVPYFPPEDRYIRLGGNMPLEPGTLLGKRALEIIRQHTGPIRTLTLDPIEEPERARLERFGLTSAKDSCTTFHSRMDTFLTCSVTRTQPSTAAP
jgi:hypothetical protein